MKKTEAGLQTPVGAVAAEKGSLLKDKMSNPKFSKCSCKMHSRPAEGDASKTTSKERIKH